MELHAIGTLGHFTVSFDAPAVAATPPTSNNLSYLASALTTPNDDRVFQHLAYHISPTPLTTAVTTMLAGQQDDWSSEITASHGSPYFIKRALCAAGYQVSTSPDYDESLQHHNRCRFASFWD